MGGRDWRVGAMVVPRVWLVSMVPRMTADELAAWLNARGYSTTIVDDDTVSATPPGKAKARTYRLTPSAHVVGGAHWRIDRG